MLTAGQLELVKQYTRYIPKGAHVFVAMHAPAKMYTCLLYTSGIFLRFFISGKQPIRHESPDITDTHTFVITLGEGFVPVSYTHLDVYKRQL